MSIADPRHVLEVKRDGGRLDPDDLRACILGYARGEIPDYQASAVLMAAIVNGLDDSNQVPWLEARDPAGERDPQARLRVEGSDPHFLETIACLLVAISGRAAHPRSLRGQDVPLSRIETHSRQRGGSARHPRTSSFLTRIGRPQRLTIGQLEPYRDR